LKPITAFPSFTFKDVVSFVLPTSVSTVLFGAEMAVEATKQAADDVETMIMEGDANRYNEELEALVDEVEK